MCSSIALLCINIYYRQMGWCSRYAIYHSCDALFSLPYVYHTQKKTCLNGNKILLAYRKNQLSPSPPCYTSFISHLDAIHNRNIFSFFSSSFPSSHNVKNEKLKNIKIVWKFSELESSSVCASWWKFLWCWDIKMTWKLITTHINNLLQLDNTFWKHFICR